MIIKTGSEEQESNFIPEPELPLSPIQIAILADLQLDPFSTCYNVPLAFHISGQIDLSALRFAIDSLVNRHEILRTIYVEGDDGPIQAIADECHGLLKNENVEDISLLEPSCITAGQYVFDLQCDLPFRAVLFSASSDLHALSIVFHHIAVDGWSIRLLLTELSSAYAAALDSKNSVSLGSIVNGGGHEEGELQYADWAGWWTEKLESNALVIAIEAASKRYSLGQNLECWPERIEGAQALFKPFSISGHHVRKLEVSARQLGVTLHSLLLGAQALLVARMTGQQNLLIGMPVALRDLNEVQNVVGCFINVVPVLVKVKPEITVVDYLKQISASVLQAIDDKEIPLGALLRNAEKESGAAPNIRLFFNFDAASVEPPIFGDCKITDIDCDKGTAKFDFMLSMLRVGDEIRGGFDFTEGIISKSDQDTLIASYNFLLDEMVNKPSDLLSTLSRLGPEEKTEVIIMGRGEKHAFTSKVETLSSRILEIAHASKTRLAVKAPDGIKSFGDFASDAEDLARILSEKGITKGDRVAIILPRCIALPISMLAAMTAGALYVPIEPNLPDARIAYLLEDSEPAAVICAPDSEQRIHKVIESINAPIEMFSVSDGCVKCSNLIEERDCSPSFRLEANDAAYMIYTSGSTGKPKGVVVSHRSVLSYLDWAIQAYGVKFGNGTSVVTSTAFDATILSFWAPLLVGRPINLLPEQNALEELSGLLDETGNFSFIKMTPAHLDILAELESVEDRSGSSNCFVIGGEALTRGAVKPWLQQCPNLKLFNEYGPTETVVGCCVHQVSMVDLESGTIPIGRPINNTSLYVLDESLNQLPIGTVGELFVGGAGVAWGYWRRPGLTAEKFLADPFSEELGARMYRTGDLVRMRSDGVFEFLGRCDDQIKVRGFRIEPDEIESEIRGIDQVQSAAVVAVGDGGDKKLVAYVVGNLTEQKVKEILTTLLPVYMVPDHIIFTDTIPLTINGKIDRQRLRNNGLPKTEALVPNGIFDEQGERLIDAWRQVLNQHIGPETDFFAAGGTSLSAIRLVAKLKREFEEDLTYRDLVAAPTPRSMLNRLAEIRPPTSRQEGQVLELVREVLSLPALSSNEDIFSAGANSLQAIRIIAQLRRVLGRDLPANLVHKGKTASGIAKLLQHAKENIVSRPIFDKQGPSPAEKQLWLDAQTEQGASRYVMQAAFAITAHERPVDLEKIPQKLAQRHPLLRTIYKDVGGELAIEVLDATPISISIIEELDRSLEQSIARISKRDARGVFNLSDGTSWRISVIHGANESIFVLSVHHILADAASLNILLRDLVLLASGGDLPKSSGVSYREFAGLRAREVADREDVSLAYWEKALSDVPAPLELPLDRRRKMFNSSDADSVIFNLTVEETSLIREFAQSQGVSLQSVVVSAYAVLLARLSSATDLVIGIPVNHRPEGHEDVIGLYLDTLPLRVSVTNKISGKGLVANTASQMIDLLGNTEASLARIVELVDPTRQPGRTPLLHTVLDWQEDVYREIETNVRPVRLDVATAPFDISATLRLGLDGAIIGAFIFDTSILDQATVEIWARSFRSILKEFVVSPSIDVIRYSATSIEDQRFAVLEGGISNSTSDLGEVLQQAFDAFSNLLALEGEGSGLTYASLWKKASNHPAPSEPIALIESTSGIERVVLALSALIHGHGFALIDPALPESRKENMRERVRSLKVTGTSESELPSYIQFSSGSTGEPKAAVLSRQGLANLIVNISSELGINPGGRVAQVAAPAFDAWIWEVFTTMAGGGTLVLIDRSVAQSGEPLAQALSSLNITHATMTPSAIAALGNNSLPNLRVLVSAGEPLTEELADSWCEGRRLINAYGPCEATICTSLDEYKKGSGTPTIGRPIPGMTCLVLDPQGSLQLPGAVGELHIGGLGVGIGYIADSKLNAEKFVLDPRPGFNGQVYRTGDMVRVRGDGRLQFIGRDDRQVKVRGVRIELDEVEAVLAAIENVDHAAVRVVSDSDNQPVLAAWASGATVPEPGTLRTLMALKLPETMLPAYLVSLEQMPMTSTGKIDRSALPDPIEQNIANNVPLKGEVELTIASLAGELLGRSAPIGRFASFFTLGGHSLWAVRFAGKLSERLNKPVPLPLVFAHPTPEGLARALSEASGDCALRVLREGNGGKIYLVHSVDGSCEVYAASAAVWPKDRKVIAVEQIGEGSDLISLAESYAEQIASDSDELEDPILIAGWSLGAPISAAITQRLMSMNRVALPVLIDSAAPSVSKERFFEDDKEIANAAAQLGAGPELVDRVRANVLMVNNATLSRCDAQAAVIRAMGSRDKAALNDLGWGSIFEKVDTIDLPGTHTELLDLYSEKIGTVVERLWESMLEGIPIRYD